ncbi:MAG: hypothetical protein AAGI12_02050 [Pseudomonadota bacterium]
MIASLPMYAPPSAPGANAALWDAMRAAYSGEAPETLTDKRGLWGQWEHPEVLFSQTCGLPFRTRLKGKVHLVASPDYGLPDCPPGYYNSTIVTRQGEKPSAGMALAFNSAGSQSGWATAHGMGFRPATETGSHAASMAAISHCQADVALVDSHTLALHGLPEGLAAHGTTESTPAPPFITAFPERAEPLRMALRAAIAHAPEAAAAIGLKGVVEIDAAAYLAVPNPPAPMMAEF